MPDIIGFLEALGGQPARAPADYDALIRSLEAEPVEQQALLDRDGAALGGLLGGRTAMAGFIATPDGEQPVGDEPEPDAVPDEDGGDSEDPDRASPDR